MTKEDMKLSKFLSLILRHKPQEANIKLNEGGWCNVLELITNINKKGFKITILDIVRIVEEDDKQRYCFNNDKTMIRASQGHSIKVDLGLISQTPPDALYHGTCERVLDYIYSDGIKKMARQYVHLSQDLITASKVGSRHGKLVILTIDSKQMNLDGYRFYLSENNVWLTDFVPNKYITK